MKKLAIASLCFLLFLPSLIIFAQPVFTFGQFVVLNSSTATPVQLTNGNMLVRSVTILGKKGYQTTNTTSINIGFGTNADGQMGLTIDPGQGITIKAIRQDGRFALSNIWLDVTTANDGAVILWEPY